MQCVRPSIGGMLLYNNKLFKTVKTEPRMDKLCPLFWRSPSLIQLRELQDKYVECLEILHEAQEELKNFRNKSLPPSTTRRFHSLGLFPMVSSCSLSAATPAPCPASASIPLTFVPLCPGFSGRWDRGHHEEGITDGWSRRRRTKVFIFSPPKKPTWLPTVLPKKVWGSCTENAGNDICICIFFNPVSRLQPKRVFQTVKNLNLMRQQRSSLAPSPLNIPGSNQTSCLTSGRSSRAGTPRSNSIYGGEVGSGIILDNKTSSILESPDDG